MLASVPSSMLTEWMGYEQANGLIGNRYIEEVLASIQEWLQQLTILTAGDKEAKVQSFPRPNELYEQAKRRDGTDGSRN